MHRGRPPSAKTLVDRQLGRNIKHPVLPAGDDYIVPNLSGDHSAGRVDTTPTDDLDIPNKKYVDTTTTANPIYVLVAGDTMTGILTFSGGGLDMGLNDINSVNLLNVSGKSTLGVLTVKTNVLTVGVITGKVGIGTAIPDELLHVLGNAKITGTLSGGGSGHDQFSDFVANEHIDWTSTSSNFSTSGTAATGELTVTGKATISDALFVNLVGDKFSQFGPTPSVLGVSDAVDSLVAVKSGSADTGNIRGAALIGEYTGTGTRTGGGFALNAFFFHTGAGDYTGTSTSGEVGGRYATRIRSVGTSGDHTTITRAGGIASVLSLQTAADFTDVTDAYAYIAEGNIVQDSNSTITNSYNFWGQSFGVRNGTLTNNMGFFQEELTDGATTNIEFGTTGAGMYAVGVVVGTQPTEYMNQDNDNDLDFHATTNIDFSIGASEIMRVDSTGVGIGTSSPAFPLDVTGAGRFTGTMHAANARVDSIDDSASTANSGINFGGASKFINFETDASERMRIITDGKVGFGLAAPTSELHVQGTGSPTLHIEDTGAGVGTILLDGDSAGADTDVGSLIGQWNNNVVASVNFRAGADFTNKDEGRITFLTAAAGGSMAEHMRVTELGTVGIGKTAPDAKLHVDQSSTTGAKPVLMLDQADISEEIIEFATTIGTGNSIEAVGAKTLTTTHFIKVKIPGGLIRYIPCGTIA